MPLYPFWHRWEKTYALVWWAAVATFAGLCAILPSMLYFGYPEAAMTTLLSGLAIIFTLGGIAGLMLLVHYIVAEVL